MFVDIENNKSPLAVEVMLHPYKKGKNPITPEVCVDVLKSTNYPRSIRDMLNLIAILPESEQENFKEVVLSTFENREQPDDVVILGKKLAENGGYAEEFDKLKNKPRFEKCLASSAETQYWDVIRLNRQSEKNGDRLWIAGGNVRVDCDVVFSSYGARFFLSNCDFEKIRFDCGANVNFYRTTIFQPNVDVSMCHNVTFQECNMQSIKNLKLGNNAKVDFYYSENLPKDIDFSHCSEVSFQGCDVSSIRNLSFAEGQKISLYHAKNLPSDLDVSPCSEISLHGCKLDKMPNLVFREGADVDLEHAEGVVSNLDFSKCSKVRLFMCMTSDNVSFKFRDMQQFENSYLKVVPNWRGHVFLADGHEINPYSISRYGGGINIFIGGVHIR